MGGRTGEALRSSGGPSAPPAPTRPAIRFRNVTLGYDRHPAVHHLSGEVSRGALLAVVGPNGAGKSTLLKGIAGLLRPLEGAIEVCPEEPGEPEAGAGSTRGGRLRAWWRRVFRPLPGTRIAYLPQQHEIDRSFPLEVMDLVAMGLWPVVGALRAIGRAEALRIREALAQVGLEGFESRAIGTLSGGQLQRALFARLLLQDAPLVLLDEPFAAVDARTVEDLLAIVRRWHAEGRTVLVVLHDLELVRAFFPETLLLAREPVAWGVTREVLTPQHLAAARALSEAFDEGAGVCERDEAA